MSYNTGQMASVSGNNDKNLYGMVVTIFLLFNTIIFLLACVYLVRKGYKSKHWPSVEGTVIESRVYYSNGESAHMTYSYVVNGRKYTGNNITVESIFWYTTRSAGRIASRSKKGDRIKVYYNPENPGDSVLKVGVCPETYIGLVLGIIFLLVEIEMIKRSKKGKTQPHNMLRGSNLHISGNVSEPPPLPVNGTAMDPAREEKIKNIVIMGLILLTFVVVILAVFLGMRH